MSIMSYLAELEENNNREWFAAHQAERKEAQLEFEALIQAILLRLGKNQPFMLSFKPRELTFKQTRDTRFSADKSPYLPAFRCHMGPKGKLPIPTGAYLYLRPGGRSFLGGGLFADMFKEATQSVREAIDEQPRVFAEIAETLERRQLSIQGSKLKKVPRGFDPRHPAGEFLKYKSWYVERPFEDVWLEDPQSFADAAAEVYADMQPLNDFLNRALEGFRMPER